MSCAENVRSSGVNGRVDHESSAIEKERRSGEFFDDGSGVFDEKQIRRLNQSKVFSLYDLLVLDYVIRHDNSQMD